MTWIHIVIISAGFFAWMLALGQLFTRNPGPGNFAFAGLLFCSGAWWLYGALLYSNLLPQYPYLYLSHVVPAYLVGPLVRRYLLNIRNGRWPMSKTDLAHLISAALSLLWLLPAYFSGGAYKACLQEQTLHILSLPETCGPISLGWYEKITIVVITLPKFSLLIYLLQAGYSIYSYPQQPGGNRLIPMTVLGLTVLMFVSVAIAFLGHLFLGRFLVIIGMLLSIGWLVGIYIVGQRLPEYLQMARLNRASTWRLENLDVPEILKRLKALMEEERLYTDEELTMSRLSRRLSVPPHQLSAVLNEYTGRNFSQYVNEYRIEDSKRLLTEEPERTILSIAFASGFNAKNTFNRVFKQHTGMTPNEYRKKFRGDSRKKSPIS